ncbi:aspartyl protease family protein [bacterium]|nr:aspartyl protease family protein [bacterium]
MRGPLDRRTPMYDTSSMGTFRESVRISPLSNGSDGEVVDAIVDSGAAYTWIPAPLLEKLGVSPGGTRKLKLADGRIIEKQSGVVRIALRGQTGPTWVIFGDPDGRGYMGADLYGMYPPPSLPLKGGGVTGKGASP